MVSFPKLDICSFILIHSFCFFFFFPKWLNYLCCLSSTFSVHLSRVTERTPCEAAGRLWHAGPLCCACKSVPGWEGHVKIRGPGESLTPLTPYLEKTWHWDLKHWHLPGSAVPQWNCCRGNRWEWKTWLGKSQCLQTSQHNLDDIWNLSALRRCRMF